MKIGFIGLGNMAAAMIGGMLGTGAFHAEEIVGSARTQETADGSADSTASPPGRTTERPPDRRMC